MFCPNCGTQNEGAANPCKKCGFKLSGISVPRFKGTMMLNSDQTGQELIEEHRRKAQEVAAEKSKGRVSEPAPKKAPGSSAPPSSLGGSRGPVLQPPRAAAPTRGRMGGTMMGVAPQAGGIMPQAGARAPAPVPAPPVVAPSAAEPTPTEAPTSNLGGHLEESEPVLPDTGSADAWAGGAQLTQPHPGTADEQTPQPTAAAPSLEERASFTPVDDGDRPSEDLADAPEPIRTRALAVTAPPQQQRELVAAADLAEAKISAPPRLRVLDLVLIVCTFGLYAIVLRLKRRKPVSA